ncbi:hypothetical protein V8B97DRAFT_1654323 [Scleroderma yunnanense]
MSWLKAKDWVTGEEYSKLFHSGLRAISARFPFAQRNQSTRVISSDEMHDGRKSCTPLPYHIRRHRNTTTKRRGERPPVSVDTQTLPSHRHKGAHSLPSSMLVPPASDPRTPESSDSEIEAYKTFFLDDYAEPPQVDYVDLFSPRTRSSPFHLTLWDGVSQRESFLSLAHSPVTSTHPFPSFRERCLSLESLPPSRRSSLHDHPLANDEMPSTDDAWMLEQSSPKLHAQQCGVDADVSDMSLDVDATDWRQFHIDWLSSMSLTQKLSP